MASDSIYCRKVSDEISIENGIMRGVKIPSSVKYENFGELILERLRANEKFVGLVDGLSGREETFEEMTDKSVKCAIWLKRQNLEAGDVVGICTHNQMDMYVPCFASLYIGAIYNAWWNTGLTKEMAKHFVELTRPKILFVTVKAMKVAIEAIEEIGADVKIVVFEGESSDNDTLEAILNTVDSKEVPEFRCAKLSSPRDAAVILWTSGSTGKPKGVVYSHFSLFHNIKHFIKIGNVKNTVTLTSSPLSWLTGIYGVLRGAVAPDRRIIYPGFDEEKFCQIIEKHKVNWLQMGTNPACRLEKYLATSSYDLSSLELLFVGGSAMKDDIQASLKRLLPGTFVCQGYGTTELAAAGLLQNDNYEIISCGRVCENAEMKIIDPETGRILNPKETGEACFNYPYIMNGYYRNTEATEEMIDPQGWLRTGDLMYYDEDGNVFFVDRIKEMIKYRGHHVSPTMIEQLLQSHPGIFEVAVVSITHDIDGEHPVAFVAAKKSAARITEEEIQKIVADALPDYMKLRGGVKFLDELPHTASDKIARSRLKDFLKSSIEEIR